MYMACYLNDAIASFSSHEKGKNLIQQIKLVI